PPSDEGNCPDVCGRLSLVTSYQVPMRLIGLVLALSLALAPLAAEAQQKGKVYRIGLLSIATVTYIDAFRQGLRDLGYVEGRTIVIEYREAQSYERLPELAKELVGLKPDIIVSAGGSLVARAVKAVTSTIPVVFLASDVVAGGLVASLSRPDGNLTGLEIFTTQLDAKRLEILKEALPTITKVAVLWNPGSAAHNPSNLADQRRGMEAAAQAVGVRLGMLEARDRRGIDTVFRTIQREEPGALLVGSDAIFTSGRQRIVELAMQLRIPSMYGWREFVEVGGFMSYGTSLPDLYRRAATYVDKILKGAKPADLPVEQPTKFELVINLKTAKALGLTIPQSLLVRADEIIR